MLANRRSGWLAVVAAAATVALVTAACGGGDPAQDFRRGGAEAAAAVEGYLDGWIAGSGPRGDTIAGAQARRFLGCELADRVRGLRIGGTQTELPLETVYNQLMSVPFPPDERFTIIESSGDEATATVHVKLNYSGTAATDLASLGVVPFSRVQELHDQVIHGPERMLYLERDEEVGWQVCRIEVIN
jgi:hypothetical protein